MTKKIIIIALLLLVLAAVLLAAAALNLSTIAAHFEADLERMAGRAVGMPVDFGTIDARVFPTPRVEIRDVAVGEEGALASRVERLTIGADFLPLLHKTISITSLELEGLQLHMVRDAAGVRVSGRSSKTPEHESSAPLPPRESNVRVNLQRVRIRNATADLEDRVHGRRLHFRDLSLQTGLHYSRDMVRASELEFSGMLPLNIPVEADTPLAAYGFEEGALEVRDLLIRSGDSEMTVSGRYDIRARNGSAELSSLSLELAALQHLIPPAAIQNIPAGFSGSIEGAGSVTVAAGELQQATLALRAAGVKGRYEGLLIADGAAEGRAAVRDRAWSIELQSASSLVGEQGESVWAAAFAEGGSRPFKASLHIRSQELTTQNLRPILETRFPQLKEWGVQGSFAPDVELTVAGGTVSRVGGRIEVRNGSADYRGFPLRAVSGQIKLDSEAKTMTASTGSLSMKVGPRAEELRVRGRVTPLERRGDLRVEGGTLTLENLAPVVPTLSKLRARGSLRPDLDVRFVRGAARIGGRVDVEEASWEAGQIVFSNVSGSLQIRPEENAGHAVRAHGLSMVVGAEHCSVDAEAVISGEETTVRELQMEGLFGGHAAGRGRVRRGSFEAQVKGSDLIVERVLAFAAPQARGKASGKVRDVVFDVRGELGEGLGRSLRGEGRLLVRDGVLYGANLGRLVLEKAGRIPFLAGALYDEVPAEFRRYFESPDTAVRRLEGSVTLGGEAAHAKRIELESDVYTVTGGGKVGLDSEIDLDASITFDRDLSTALAARVRELRRALDRDSTLTLPLAVRGTWPRVAVYPDLQKILELSAQRTVERTLEDALRGNERGRQRRDGGAGKRSPIEELLRGLGGR